MPTACIPLEKAKPGMKLAEDVVNTAGMVLCRSGTELTEALIQRLENMGVEKVLVEEPMSAEKTRQLLEEKRMLVEEAFKGKNTACMRMLKHAFLNFWEKKYSLPVK